MKQARTRLNVVIHSLLAVWPCSTGRHRTEYFRWENIILRSSVRDNRRFRATKHAIVDIHTTWHLGKKVNSKEHYFTYIMEQPSRSRASSDRLIKYQTETHANPTTATSTQTTKVNTMETVPSAFDLSFCFDPFELSRTPP